MPIRKGLRIRTRVQKCLKVCTHVSKCLPVHTRVQVFMRTPARPQVFASTQACAQVFMGTYAHAQVFMGTHLRSEEFAGMHGLHAGAQVFASTLTRVHKCLQVRKHDCKMHKILWCASEFASVFEYACEFASVYGYACAFASRPTRCVYGYARAFSNYCRYVLACTSVCEYARSFIGLIVYGYAHARANDAAAGSGMARQPMTCLECVRLFELDVG